jgi:hypothetical protein
MVPQFRLPLAFAALAPIAFAQNPHPVRAPFVVETIPAIVDQYDLASDGEISLLAYHELIAPNRILARTADGRGLVGTWTVGIVSEDAGAERRLPRGSVHVAGGRGIVVWIEKMPPSNRERLVCGRFDGVQFLAPTIVNDSIVPASHDVVDVACAMRVGPNGLPYVALVFATLDPATNAIGLFGVISPNAGQSFNAPFPLSILGLKPGSATEIGGVAVDLKGGEFHAAWTDDRDDPGNEREVFYRRALLDFAGNAIFAFPLGSGPELAISHDQDVVGDPVIAVDDDPTASGGFAKHVGIAWRELDKGPTFPTLYVRASHDSGTNFVLETVVAHTGLAGLAVEGFDFELCGGSFVATFADNARDVGGNVVVAPLGVTQVWRATSPDGADFSTTGGGQVTMLSGGGGQFATGDSPVLTRVRGAADAAAIAYRADDLTGAEIVTSFADQEFGAAWHLDEAPRVSAAQSGPLVRDVRAPRAAYNARYSNFLSAWQQEIAPDTGVYDLLLGGYRPQTLEIVGWFAGSAALSFRFDHLPVQDSFAFVLLSATAAPNPSGQFVLPDGRRTGLANDLFMQVGLSNWTLFAIQNNPLQEGGSTLTIPLPPGLVQPGLSLSAAGVSWGANGTLHVVTDFVTAKG